MRDELPAQGSTARDADGLTAIRTGWLTTSGWALLVGLLLILRHGQWFDADMLGAVIAGGEALLLAIYAFHRATAVSAARDVGRPPPSALPMMIAVAALTGMVAICALIGSMR